MPGELRKPEIGAKRSKQFPIRGFDANSAAHFLGRALKEQGHDVRLILTQFLAQHEYANETIAHYEKC